MRELCQLIFIHDRMPFKRLEALPGPGVGISRWGIAPPVGVVDAYKGYGAAGDRAQELRDAREQADGKLLERVTGPQKCLEGLQIVCQDS